MADKVVMYGNTFLKVLSGFYLCFTYMLYSKMCSLRDAEGRILKHV